MTDELLETIGAQLPVIYPLTAKLGVKALNYSENRIYLIQEMDSEIKYILRVHRPGYHTKEEFEGELLWMKEISEQTDIILPGVYQGINREYLQSISTKNGEAFTCILFSYLKGHTLGSLEENERMVQLKQVGRILAKLHNQSQNRDDTAKIVRFSWDVEDLLGEKARWGDWRDYSYLKPEQKEIFADAERIILQRVKNFGRTPEHFGLIHSDIHSTNLIIHEDKIQLIDFDDCGYGWYLYDIGCSLVKYPFIDGLTEAILEGYESVRPLTQEEKEALPTFLLLRRIVRFAWLAGHADSDTAGTVTGDYLLETVRMAERYCEEHRNRVVTCY